MSLLLGRGRKPNVGTPFFGIACFRIRYKSRDFVFVFNLKRVCVRSGLIKGTAVPFTILRRTDCANFFVF